MNNTSKKLKEARARKGHTQEQAAREIGVTWVTVCRWESGKSQPRGLSKAALADYVGPGLDKPR